MVPPPGSHKNMELDKSILLQKQVRDNSSDLHSEYLDLKNWEEQMRRKDSELSHAAGDQITLPPVRSKKKIGAKKTEPKVKESNAKRIKSSDYVSWDKFDVDKACEELDVRDAGENSDEELTNEELEENHNRALQHKEKGNLFVKEQRWSQAVRSYDEAIEIFPYDAVFYANRALCHLKMDNLYSAETDCTTAIRLDEFYVKAYHRRATVRNELKQYKEAVNDLEKILKLDATNKEAGRLLAQVKKKLEISKPVVVTQAEIEDDTPIEKKIGEKLFGGSVKKSVTIERKSVTEKRSSIPIWTLGEGEDVAIVEPIVKPPHHRSKKPLRRIEVKEKEESKKSNRENPPAESAKPIVNETIPVTITEQQTSSTSLLESSDVEIGELPPVPRTTVQFFMNWKKNKNAEFRYKYLKQMPADTIHKIFKDSMEPDTFSEILTILSSEFVIRKEPLFRYLEDLAKVKRFGALTMFMTSADKKALNAIFQHCETFESKPKDAVALMRKKYEI